jgi:hypothetical protein
MRNQRFDWIEVSGIYRKELDLVAGKVEVRGTTASSDVFD